VEPKTANRAFKGAYRKGYQARIDGKSNLPPYPDKRAGRREHITTYSRAFRKYWLEGWQDADKEIAKCQEQNDIPTT